MKKTNCRKETLASHPDENSSVDKGCQAMNEEWSRVDYAHEKSNAIDENGKSGRFTYDFECDEVIKTWKNHVMHNDDGASYECSCQEKL